MKIRKGNPATAASASGTYDSKQFTISGAQTDYDVAVQQTMFVTLRSHAFIKTNIASTIKLNSAAAAGIPLAAGEQFETPAGFSLSDVFITTTADTIIRIVAF